MQRKDQETNMEKEDEKLLPEKENNRPRGNTDGAIIV